MAVSARVMRELGEGQCTNAFAPRGREFLSLGATDGAMRAVRLGID
jgi:hypothetical protein